MQVSYSNTQNRLLTLNGICPHSACNAKSAFLLVTSLYNDPNNGYWVGTLQCQACRNYILAVTRILTSPKFDLLYYLPRGSPNDDVAPEIPDHIQADFKEALRCMFVNAFNATAEMCRRALESSCIERGAPPNKVLEKMIDWLEAQRIITPFLKDVAHKIRLGGNRGAHPPEDGAEVTENPEVGPVAIIEKEHAEAIVTFTREFFHHVYVVPKELEKYDFSKPAPIKLPTQKPAG
jgi:hypothetical protein